MKMSTKDWSLLVLLSLLWGGSFFFAEIALREVSAWVTVWGRVCGAALVLLVLLKIQGIELPKDVGIWGAFFVMGLLNNALPFSLIVWGQTEISSSLAAIFNATTPLFTIVLAQFLTDDEKISPVKLMGLVIGFAGVGIMIGLDVIEGIGASAWAQIAILLAAISYGCAAIWGRRFKNVRPMVVATGQVSCSTLLMTPVVYFFGFPDGLFMPSLTALGAVLGLALFCTVIAYILYFKILATCGATNLMLVTFLIPVSAISLGVLLLGEELTPEQLTGMALVLSGLLIIDGRMFDLLPPKKQGKT